MSVGTIGWREEVGYDSIATNKKDLHGIDRFYRRCCRGFNECVIPSSDIQNMEDEVSRRYFDNNVCRALHRDLFVAVVFSLDFSPAYVSGELHHIAADDWYPGVEVSISQCRGCVKLSR